VGDMTGRVFTKPIVLADDVPQEIADFAENIDLAGRHINVFARDVFYDALQTGVGYILVDMPIAPKQAKPRTRAESKAAGLRPYLVYLTVEQLIGWKSEMIGGVETLTQVRIREFVTEPDGDFHETHVEQIRVLEPGKWTIYRKRAGGSNIAVEWIEYESGATSLKKITLVPVYLNRTGFMTGAPPLADLADLNVAHWQSSSDQRNILHVARVPILVGSGFEEADQIAVGASSMIRTTNPSATLKYVEHSGAAIGAGRDELKDLEFQMQAQGLQLLVPQPGSQTATGEIRDDVKERSQLATMAAALQDVLEVALGYMAEFIGESRGGGSVAINSDFGVSPVGDFTMLLNAVNSDQISRTTFWREAMRRGVLADDFDPDIEAALLDEQAPKLGMDLG
ncbi:MAG: DUF4055 domain-containing protein, partial [Gammaproteobacteria bacterium]|nr:DUF4055 domain-containing protein [Gammaproteobacteria bacterium]